MTIPVDEKKLTDFVNQIELEYLSGFKPQARASDLIYHSLNVNSTFSFSIHCVSDSGYTVGRLSADSYSSADCRGKIDHFIRGVRAGTNAKVIYSLQGDVKNRPLYLYHNPQTYDSVRHSYCESCNTCGGSGKNTCYQCSNGYISCHHCSSGYIHCYSCSGVGSRWENNRQVTCGQCSGGRLRCHICSGSGRTTCGWCYGQGEVNCSPCSATGYFTYWMSAEAGSKAEQACRWNLSESPEWINAYLKQSLVAQTHLPINRAVPWNFAKATYQLQTIPFKVNVDGLLNTVEANINIGDVFKKGLFLVPDTIEIWSLNNALDQAIGNISDYLNNNLNYDALKKYLQTKISHYALESINKPSSLPSPIAAPQLMSGEGFNQVKSTIIQVAKKYDNVRSLISPKRWLTESLVCSGVLVALLFFVNFFVPQANGTNIGLAAFFKSVPHLLGVLDYELSSGVKAEHLPVLFGLMGGGLLLMVVLGSGRAWSRFRLSYWFVIATLVVTGLIWQLDIALQQPVVANWWAFNLIFDAVLCGVLAGLFRARRYVYKNIGREINKLESDAFARILNYKE